MPSCSSTVTPICRSTTRRCRGRSRQRVREGGQRAVDTRRCRRRRAQARRSDGPAGGTIGARNRSVSGARGRGAVARVPDNAAILRRRHAGASSRFGSRAALMIITRTPFRISFAGGGTDLRAFYVAERGVVLASAIDKYIYITVNRRFDRSIRVSYSRTEIVEHASRIEHPIVREALALLGMGHGL